MNRAIPELSKSHVLTTLFTSTEIEEVLKKINPAYIRDDVRQHVFLILFEKDEAFIIDLHERGKLRSYVAKTLYNTAHYSESSFNRQLRRRTEIPTDSFEGDSKPENDESTKVNQTFGAPPDQEEPYDYEALVESCSLNLSKIYWYNRDMLRLYVELGSYQKVSDATGIPKRSVYDAVKKAKEDMKKLLWE